MITDTDVKKLSKQKQELFWFEYDRRKLNTGNAWLLWFFGLHYLHTKKVGLWLLYVVSCFLYVGIVRWIIQGFLLTNEIEKKNIEIQDIIYYEVLYK